MVLLRRSDEKLPTELLQHKQSADRKRKHIEWLIVAIYNATTHFHLLLTYHLNMSSDCVQNINDYRYIQLSFINRWRRNEETHKGMLQCSSSWIKAAKDGALCLVTKSIVSKLPLSSPEMHVTVVFESIPV